MIAANVSGTSESQLRRQKRIDLVRAENRGLRSLEAWVEPRLKLEHAANVFPLAHVLAHYIIFGLLLWPNAVRPFWIRAPLWILFLASNYSLSIGIIHIHAHRSIFTHPGLNRLLEFLLCFPSLNSYPMMRYVHVYMHHKHEDGPDDPTSTIRYRKGWRILLYWATYTLRCVWITKRALFASDARPVWRKMRTQFCVDTLGSVLIVEAWAFFHFQTMFMLWLVPALIVWTNCGFFAWLTHAPAYSGPINGSFNTTNRWMNFFIHNQGFHVVHHRHPAIHWTAIPEYLDLMTQVDDRLIVPYWVLLPSACRVATPRALYNESFARRWKQRYLEKRDRGRVRMRWLSYFVWI